MAENANGDKSSHLTQALQDLADMYIFAENVLIIGQREAQEAAECDCDEKTFSGLMQTKVH